MGVWRGKKSNLETLVATGVKIMIIVSFFQCEAWPLAGESFEHFVQRAFLHFLCASLFCEYFRTPFEILMAAVGRMVFLTFDVCV